MESSSKRSATAKEGPICIHRFAVRVAPPTLVVEYGRGGEARMLKYIKIRSSPQKTAADVVDKLVSTFPELLGERTANRDQLEALVARIIDHGQSKLTSTNGTTASNGSLSGGRRADEAAGSVTTPREPRGAGAGLSSGWGGDEFGDLNKASDAEVLAAKARMDSVFEANRLRQGQAGFEYDRRVDFGEPDSDAPADWDDDEESEDEREVEDEFS